MKTEFKAKFLQHVAKRKREEGFTLIELLVVIIIIGILSAIALPSFLNQANKAKQSEGKQYISSINKGQQAIYAEDTKFGTSVEQLGIGLKSQTNNYKYTIPDPNNDVGASALAAPASGALLAYAGGVGLVTAGEAKTTQSILCQEQVTGEFTDPSEPTLDANGAAPECVAGTQSEVTK